MKTLKRIQELILESTELLIPRGAVSIPRHEMPQIELEDYPKIFEILNQHGISVTCKKLVGRNLRAAQKEINKGKVAKWAKSLPKGALQKYPIVSADFYMVDGNHTWLALLNHNPEIDHINCYQIGLPLHELLDFLKSLDLVTYKTVNEEKSLWPKYDSWDSPFQIMRNT